MKRRVFTVYAALSLLLCVATAVLGVRSFWVLDLVFGNSATNLDREYTFFRIASRGGLLRAVYTYRQNYRGWEPTEASPFGFEARWLSRADKSYSTMADGFGWFEVAGIHAGTYEDNDAAYLTRAGQVPESKEIGRFLVLPYWVVVGLTAPIPLAWLINIRRIRLRNVGAECMNCGYDSSRHARPLPGMRKAAAKA